MAATKGIAIGLIFTAIAVAGNAYGQLKRDPINGNETNNGSSVKQILEALARTSAKHPDYDAALKRLNKGVGLVFVPGILGSTLESPTVGKIWGFGIPDPSKLALPANLIDPGSASDVKAQLAESVMGVSLYGEAMKMIRASAGKAGIAPERIVACGYDWRRDIRSGARDLQDCVDNAPELAGADALVIVAHSMGGLVTWAWLQEKAAGGELPNGVRVLGVAVLGSPLAGSCEIVRMVASGYVQPEANEQYVRGTWLALRWNDIKAMKDRVVNAVSALFSDSIRPLVLTWPGAMDLSPPPAASRYDRNCALVPLNPDDLGDSRILTHYMPSFWTGPLGADMMKGVKLPATLDATLRQAAQFRSGFKATTLASPTYLYASQAWMTPGQAPVDASQNYRLANASWVPEQGDGRVPFVSAVPEGVAAAEVLPLYSVHGNLPEDEIFHSMFFGERLPRVLAAWVATQMIARAAGDQQFLADYLADKGPFAQPADFYTAFEPDRGARARYPITNDSRDLAIAFNDALCAAGAKCADYAGAKKLAGAAKQDSARASILSASLRSGTLSDDDAAFTIAQRGLVMAIGRNWTAAISDLRKAAVGLEDRRKRLGGREPEKERMLRVSVNANLGRALVMRGFCAESRAPLQVGASGGNALAARTLKEPCYDRESGKILALAR